MSILYGAETTDHIPVAMAINVENISVLSRNGNSVSTEKLDWSTLTNEDILDYYAHTEKSLCNIHLPRDAIL